MTTIEMIKWAEDILLSNGYTIDNPPEDIQTTPWSSVKRFSTSNGYVYLKQVPTTLSLEPVIIQHLRDQFQETVPIIIDINKNLFCFLMKDSGIQLRKLFKLDFQSDLLCRAIKKYTDIQHSCVKHINSLIELGVPDWRLEKLPNLYNQFISKENLLKEDGITINEFNALQELSLKFESTCKLLSRYKIPETLDHCDFHDGNILIENNTKKLTIIDWGETVITHPFFSLISCLNNTVHRYKINESDKTYIELQHACFDCDLFTVVPKRDLLESIILAKELQPIYRALGFYRLKISSNAEAFKAWPEGQGCIARPLREFIKIFKA